MQWQAIANSAGVVVVIVGALSALGLVARWFTRGVLSMGHTAGLAGKAELQIALTRIEAVLGEMKTETAHRLDGLETAVRAVDGRLVAVEYQVAPNGGGSMRDKVVKTVALLEQHLTEHHLDIALTRYPPIDPH